MAAGRARHAPDCKKTVTAGFRTVTENNYFVRKYEYISVAI